MNGYEATSAIRALDRPDAARILILAATADAFSEDIKRTRQAGMNAHITKPIDFDQLEMLLTKLFKEKQITLSWTYGQRYLMEGKEAVEAWDWSKQQ